MLSEQSQAIVLERETGATLTEIGARHGVSHQRVSVINRAATAFVTEIELALMVARKLGQPYALLIPDGDGIGLDFAAWLVGRLRRRDLHITVSTTQAANALIVLLADTTDYASPTGDPR